MVGTTTAPASHPISQELSGGSGDAFDDDCDDAHLSEDDYLMGSDKEVSIDKPIYSSTLDTVKP